MFALLLIYVVVRYFTTLFPAHARLLAIVGLVLTAAYCVQDYRLFLDRTATAHGLLR